MDDFCGEPGDKEVAERCPIQPWEEGGTRESFPMKVLPELHFEEGVGVNCLGCF